MVRDAPAEDSVQEVDMTSDEERSPSAEFPAGLIAQAWLDEHSRQLTWADLVRWLGDAG